MPRKKPTTLGERIRSARLLIEVDGGGLSARQLDGYADLTKGHTSLIEAGHRDNLESRTLQGLARVLGMSLDWLIAGDGDPPTKEAAQAAFDRTRRAALKTGT